MLDVIYYTSATGNTKSFIDKIGVCDPVRIPVKMETPVLATKPYILFIPTYASNDGRGALPKSVVKFLNIEQNRFYLKGLVASGNTNFGINYCLAGDIISAKCAVPILYQYELRGNSEDVLKVKEILLNA